MNYRAAYNLQNQVMIIVQDLGKLKETHSRFL